MYVILSNRIDQKQITVAGNKRLVLKKYVPRSNSPDLPVGQEYYQSNFNSSKGRTRENYAYDCYPKKPKITF